MGGYDIFKTTYENGKWTKPENLGYPINTTGDDLYFTLSTSGVNGYYSSSHNKDSYGSHDIYKITFRGAKMNTINNNEDNLLAISDAAASLEIVEPELEIASTNVTLLKGQITDEFTGDPLLAEIELTDLASNKIIATFKSNKSTGKYLVTLPSGKNYGIAVKSENCLFHSENINIEDANSQYQEIVKDIQLKRIEVGSQVTMKNIFFDTGKSTLRDESKAELQNLIDLLNEIPSLKIEISGHTDNVGSKSSNQTLSENRAKSVVDYLVEKGISPDRLTYKGYGQEKPIADNATAEGRQQNRRTMFEVLSR
jgi:outer membrane protein OmpA-like peptidoglycan-associated protein